MRFANKGVLMASQYCGPRQGAKLLEALGIDTKNLVKAVITVEVDSIVMVECVRHGSWDEESEEYKKIAETYGVTLLAFAQPEKAKQPNG
jgi:L-fucose mutarotase/ribose pyranase (RbsD/FucU family)